MARDGRGKPFALALLVIGALAAVFLLTRKGERIEFSRRSPTPRGTPEMPAPAPEQRAGPPSLISAEPFRPPVETRRDRELRERARDRILRSLDRGRGTAQGSIGGPEPVGELDKDYVQTRIRDDFLPMAKECYEAALEQNATLAGRMVFEFVIVGDESVGGIVESAELDPSSTLADAELVTCMRESLLSVTFPPPKNGGRVTVKFPFALSTSDGG
ncbi:MAG: AgmX/PglI C-terminal domain-containing protein [Polyangiaceae bacterium]